MLQTQSYKTIFRKNYFSLRITYIWNNLPKHVVEATSVNSVKNLVDGHFRNTGYITMTTNISRKWNYNMAKMEVSYRNLIIMAYG